MSNLLALDQSSHTTGYSIFINNKIEKIGHFDCRGADIGARLVDFRQTIIKIIDDYKINEIVFEDIQLQSNVAQNVKTFKMLAEVFGVLQELTEELKIKYTIVPPVVWKATFKFAGKGRSAEKKLAQAYILSNYGIKCTEDEADSACIGLHILKQNEKNEGFDWSN